MRRPDGSTVFLGTSITIALMLGLYLAFFYQNGHAGGEAPRKSEDISSIPFDGKQAYSYLEAICRIGPRPSGSNGMLQQQQMLIEHFNQLGGRVSRQQFQVRHPETGAGVEMTNIIVEWHPDRAERILICAHYDTRPFPDRDRFRPRGVFLGANDGASGAAMMMELGKWMPGLEREFGVDFVLFDGEEFVFDEQRDRDYYFLGSKYFAREYIMNPPQHRYRAGVLLDMVADAHLDFYYERNSLKYAKPLVTEIWETAQRLGVKEFIRKPRHEIRDDHLPLNEIAKIPTCDIIDFDYPRPGARQFWHTEADSPENCSPVSMAKVGWVLTEWLRTTGRK